jgi:hypothetical protein
VAAAIGPPDVRTEPNAHAEELPIRHSTCFTKRPRAVPARAQELSVAYSNKRWKERKENDVRTPLPATAQTADGMKQKSIERPRVRLRLRESRVGAGEQPCTE